ncbi:PTS galactitol enzyme II A subunit [Halobacteriales archaeon QS_1_68_17]|nr:MAG: PTS galactitol enzyme II A subunit [Halobacteriales archaeon QS_1_68_17]
MHTKYASVTGESAESVLRELGHHAVERGYAEEGYVSAILEREAEFPTGLSIPTESFGIAIPHADPEHVVEEAVILGLPPAPVGFASMDDPDETVQAEAVLLLLAGDSDGYTAFLSNLVNLFQDPAFVRAVREDDADAVLGLVDEHCL